MLSFSNKLFSSFTAKFNILRASIKNKYVRLLFLVLVNMRVVQKVLSLTQKEEHS